MRVAEFPIAAGFIGFLFGVVGTLSAANAGGAAGASMNTRFLLTRPVSRQTVLFAPLALVTVATAVIPSLTMLCLLGWLRLVRAPSLGHLLAILQQLPRVAALGAHPGLLPVLAAIDFRRRLFASLSLGLCVYMVMASQRWLLLSPKRSLKILGMMPMFVLLFPMWRLFGSDVANVLWMTAPRGAPLSHVPSVLSIAGHFAVASATLLGCWWIQRTIEI